MGGYRITLFSLCFLLLVPKFRFRGFKTDLLQSRNVIDLIQSLNLTAKNSGFTLISGFHNRTPAILLQDSSSTRRHLAVSEFVLNKALTFLHNDEITFLGTIRQEIGDSGSIISFSSDIIRFLEIESSGRKDEIRFHYTHDQQIRVETFPYRLADNQWHKLALSLSGTQLTLFIDCNKIYDRTIQSVDRQFLAGKLSLFVGQRNDGQHALFRGALQDVKIVTQSHGYLLQCPNQDTSCPTCAQYLDLEKKMQEIYNLYHNLSSKLLQAEEKISGLEQCECSHGCSDNGTVRKEGESWIHDSCTQCKCMNGSIECKHQECPQVDCINPVYRDGECCPICLTDCLYNGKYYDHGETTVPRVCVTCTCDDGRMVCQQKNPKDICKPLDCPENKILKIEGECCPVCEGTDFCSEGHDCHVNATCVNLATKYACQCVRGFQGDGIVCEDIDECSSKGGKTGHHCNGNTVCVNTVGSYACKCANGHIQLDDYTCEAVDQCYHQKHHCSDHADCVSTTDGIHCSCKDKYEGDGQTCKPICHGGCRNGGRCIAPSVCQCRHGFIGPNCELDIDECALGIDSCQGNSVCINIPGRYSCDCLEGYHSQWPDNNFGALCLDVNECGGEGVGHTCHPTTDCVNTEGHYRCECSNDEQSCKKACVYHDEEHADGDHWQSEMDKCLTCICEEGVTTCHSMICDCETPDLDLECCPHCDKASQCDHQELPLKMMNGQRWIFQCQTCECLHGETDCWTMECPELSCEYNIQEPGDCCPQCIDHNPCLSNSFGIGGAEYSTISCLYKGQVFTHGDSWTIEGDRCATCECKVGHICCSFNDTCSTSNIVPAVANKAS